MSRDKLFTTVKNFKIESELISFNNSTHTAVDACNTLHCELGQIIRTLLFKSDIGYYLVIISGDKKVDMQKLKIITGGKRANLASPEEVIKIVGYQVGGVPCVIDTKIPIYIDHSIQRYSTLYSGGGDSKTVLKISMLNLLNFWKTQLVNISKEF